GSPRDIRPARSRPVIRSGRRTEQTGRGIRPRVAPSRDPGKQPKLRETGPATPGPCGGVTAASLPSRADAPLSAAEECSVRPRDSFRECAGCPEMVMLPPGAFTMGSPEIELGRRDSESPHHVVRIARPFAVGKTHVTVDQFAAFVGETGHAASTRCD